MKRSLLPSIFKNDKDDSWPFTSLQKEIDRVFDDFKGVMPRFESSTFPFQEGKLAPKVNVSETEDAIEITAELPGVKEEDMDLTVSSNVITIKGEKSASKEEEKKNYHLVERSYGSFARSIPLPFEINADDAIASFKDGVLTVTVKKPPEAVKETKKIKVTKGK